MRAYFDNNILISIEDKEINIEHILSKRNDVSIVYSYVHIQELLASNANFEQLREKRINTITSLTNNFYIYPDGKSIELKEENPQSIILQLQAFPFLNNMLKIAASNYTVEKDKFIELLEIDKKRINNYTSNQVIEYINKALVGNMAIELEKFIGLSGDSLREKICTLFNFLDIVGFWKDKQTEKSNLARIYDASHTYFASCCNYFVSNDRNARNKANVAYSLYNITTKAISMDEFIQMFADFRNAY